MGHDAVKIDIIDADLARQEDSAKLSSLISELEETYSQTQCMSNFNSGNHP